MRNRRTLLLFGTLGALAMTGGCANVIGGSEGGGGGGDGDPTDPPACLDEGPSVGEGRIRLLAPLQYRNTVRHLFDDPTIDVDLLDEDDTIPSALAVEKLSDAAAQLGGRGLDLLAAIPACATRDDACANAFVDAFAARAFRRPLTTDERTWLGATWTTARGAYSFDEAIGVLTQVILASPQFLYLAPIGTPVDGVSNGARHLDDYELASRLSYFLWSSMPDDELIGAAAAGELTAEGGAGLRAQAERLLEAPEARAMAHEFLDAWFQLDGGTVHFGLDEAPKNDTLYPTLTPELRADMRKEIGALMEKVAFEGGTAADLYTETTAYVNGPLARLYGVTGGPTTADDWRWVELDRTQRAGLLTRAAFATVYSTAKVQAPIRRGVFVLRKILCYDQPPPPPDVDDRPIEGPDNEGPLTIRQSTDVRTGGDDCQLCHAQINALGYAFEHYDAMGAWRATEIESGLAIDASGVLAQSGAATDGPVADAIELSEKLAQSDAAATCLQERWFEHALRRDPDMADECSFAAVRAAAGTGGSLRDVLLAIVMSDAFTHVNPGVAQ